MKEKAAQVKAEDDEWFNINIYHKNDRIIFVNKKMRIYY